MTTVEGPPAADGAREGLEREAVEMYAAGMADDLVRDAWHPAWEGTHLEALNDAFGLVFGDRWYEALRPVARRYARLLVPKVRRQQAAAEAATAARRRAIERERSGG